MAPKDVSLITGRLVALMADVINSDKVTEMSYIMSNINGSFREFLDRYAFSIITWTNNPI